MIPAPRGWHALLAAALAGALLAGAAHGAGLPRCALGTAGPDGLSLNRFHELRQLRTAPNGAARGEIDYRVGKTAFFRLHIMRPRPPGSPPITAGMPPEPAGPELRTELQVFAIGPGAKRTLLCNAEVDAARPAVSSIRIDSDAPGQNLLVRYAAIDTLPEGTTLLVRADSTLQEASELYRPRCPDLDPARLRAGFDLKPLEKAKIAAPSCRQRVTVRSSQAMLVSLRPGAPSGGAKMLAGFKPPNSYAGYSALCEATLDSGTAKHFLVGVDPSLPARRDGETRLWALDLETDCRRPGGLEIEVREVAPRTAVVQREDSAPIAPAYGAPALLTDLRLSCFSDLQFLPFVEARRRAKGGATSERPFLDLTVLRRSGGELTPAERAYVEKATLYALAAWNRACLYCGARTLSLARVNGRFYASSLLIEELNGTHPPGGPSLGPVALPADRLAAALNSRVPAYLPMTSQDLGRLCAGPLLKTLLGDGASCVEGAPTVPVQEASAELRVLLTDGFTACDSDVDTIACEQYGKQIELNVRDYSFAVGSSPEIAFGRGKRVVPLDLVIAHEIGHWLGIGHLEASGALMAATTEAARCISNADVNALQERNRVGGPGMQGGQTFRYR